MRKLTGKVVSNKMKNTAVVSVEYFLTHKLYNKRISRSRKFHAEDTLGVKTGDVVEMVETRPFSKTKHWKVTGVLNKNVTT